MFLGMVDSPLGPASLDATFITVLYSFHHDLTCLCLHYWLTALIPDNLSLVANSFRCFFWHVFVSVLLCIEQLVFVAWKAYFCLNLMLKGFWYSRFCLEQSSESQQSVSEVCLCSVICLVIGVFAINVHWLDLKTEIRPFLKWHYVFVSVVLLLWIKVF